MSFDQVPVNDDDPIFKRRNHESLLRQQGFYHNLYMSQYRRVEVLPDTLSGSG